MSSKMTVEEFVKKLRELVKEEAAVWVSNEAAYGWDSAMSSVEDLLDDFEDSLEKE